MRESWVRALERAFTMNCRRPGNDHSASLRIAGHRGCYKPGCECGSRSHMRLSVITPHGEAGVIIDSVAKADQLIANFQMVREQIWRED